MKEVFRTVYLSGAGIDRMKFVFRLLVIPVFVLFVSAPFSGYGQQKREISGTVKDNKGQPMPGVSLVVSGTAIGTVTDQNGKFRMNIPEDAGVLVVSFVGMKQQEVVVTGKNTIAVTMEEETIGIDEVVVTALGISREAKSLGYARQSVNVSSMTEARDANLTNMLAGKAAGVNIISAGGSTASTRVVIRGNTSLTGNNQPLYVVDGVIIQNDMGKVDGRSMGAEGATDLDYGNIAANLNPDDIESIEILKGANASALYGSDAANGAILITTKKAKKTADLGVTYNLNYMLNTITQYPGFQNVYGGGNSHRLGETNKYRSMAYPNMALLSPYNCRSWGLPMLGFDVVGRNGVVKTYSPNPDNVRDYFRTSHQMINNVSVSKSNEWGSFRFSYAYTNSDDVIEGANKRNRHNFTLRSDYDLTKKINLDANIRYSIDKVTDRSYSGWSERNPMMAYLFFPRDLSIQELIPWKDTEGNAIRLSSENVSEYYNPYWALNECWNEDTKNWFLSDLTIGIQLSKTLKIRLRGAADIQDSKGFDFTNKGTKGLEDGRYSTFYRTIKNFQYEGYLLYNRKFKKISLNASLGANWRDNSLYRNTSLTSKLILHDIASLSNSAEAIQTTESLETIRRESIFGAATFGYNEWIYLDMTARNDWNSTLPIDNCSYFYPSASVSFIFSDAFDLKGKVLSFGKLRASWAKVGNGTSFNQLYNNFRYAGLFNTIPIFEVGSRLKSSALKPETTYSTELGADLRFFNNKLTADLTLYSSRSIDQIMNPKIPPSTGYTEGTYNSGEIRNKGIEVSVNATALKRKDFTWDMTFNWSTNKSEVVSIMDSLSVYTLAEVGSNLRITAEEGRPYGVLRGSRQMRDADGNLMVSTSNGRAVVESDAYLGDVNPDFIGSYRSAFIYKNFDFSFMVDFKAGGKFFSRSSLHGVREGNWLSTLANRDDYTFSYTVLGEDDLERRGINKNEPSLPYSDNNRVMGARFEGILYTFDETTGTYTKVGPNNWYLQPQQYWQHAAGYLMDWFIYDASYVKLREIALGYYVPKAIMQKTPLTSAKFSLVGRNLATLYKNCPRGVDPQATNSTGNAQGIEAGFTLPTAYYGFDIKITF